jgi:hypothetical protein
MRLGPRLTWGQRPDAWTDVFERIDVFERTDGVRAAHSRGQRG